MKARSMTGFARVRRTAGNFDVTVSVKTVNHRGLDIHFHTSSELDAFENAMRTAVKKHLGRGHIDVRVQVKRAGAADSLGVDAAKLEAYVAVFRREASRLNLGGEPDLNAAFRVPGILSESAELELPSSFEQPLVAALEEALQQLDAFRSREGGELVMVMLERNRHIAQAALRLEQLRGGALAAFHTRLRERLADLLNGSSIDPQRLAVEAAVLADRSDIGEEIARLKIHSAQLEDMLTTEREVGKKLDFLLQEMNRETNTVLSKTNGIGETGLGITELALAVKSEVEKIREQALNLE